MDESVLAAVRAHMREVKTPGHYDRVYKDECMFCFATPESPGGLYINLTTHQAFDESHLELDHQRSRAALYLHQQGRRVPLTEAELAEAGQGAGKPDKMAIGVEGGFQVDAKKYRLEVDQALVVMPARLRIPLPCPDLPELVLACIAAVQAHDSASHQEQVATWQEERRVSKYAEGLEQLPATRTIPMDPKQWKCEECGVQENLWLNLSTGFIGSGRANWDGTGGTGAAMRHYEATGSKYPLAVKLGTITPHGADVYSYAPDENDMVLDPHLARHLSHWGINMMQMEKTEKTIAEMEIDANLAHEFDRITEAGAKLQPLWGPGFVGLKNLGNSCYMNSVLQVLWTLPELRQRYVDAAQDIFRTAPQHPAADFATQFAKVGMALLTGETKASTAAAGEGPEPMNYEAETVTTEGGLEAVVQDKQDEGNSVRPQLFKSLVGKGHSEFSSSRQQDAQEYFGHLLEVVAQAEAAAGGRLPSGDALPPTASLFKFGTEDRIQCSETGRVAYKPDESTCLGLYIPLEAAENREEVEQYQERHLKRQADMAASAGQKVPGQDEEERVVPRVPFAACLHAFAGDATVEDYQSAAAGGKKVQATKRTRFTSFPPYLLVQMRRYYSTEKWEPRKLDVAVAAPQQLDLEGLRGQGPQPGEELQPEEPAATAPAAGAAAPAPAAEVPAPVPDDTIVAQLVSMGFSENGSKRAALAVGNSGAEAATEWVFAHMEDPDFNDPLPAPGRQQAAAAGGAAGGAAAAAASAGPSAESLEMLGSMGFSERQARAALAACQGSLERATDWLLSHLDDLEAAVEAALTSPADGSGGAAAAAAAPTAPVAAAGASGAAAPLLDGPGKYELAGIISHMGANTACGHYVCHIRAPDGRWALFNDEKVAASEQPPFDLGYLYLYRRAQQ